MVKEKFDRTKVENIDISKIGIHENRRVPTPIITNGVVELDVDKKKTYVKGVEISEECFYSVDVVSLVVSIYGVDSDICKAMVKGALISGMIKTDISKKGKGASVRIASKKKLRELVFKEELEYLKSVNSNIDVNV